MVVSQTIWLLNAQITRVNNQSELNNVIPSISAGDTILIESSSSPYNDLEIVLKASGTIDKPIVIMAESVGGVILTGNSQVKLGGSHVYF